MNAKNLKYMQLFEELCRLDIFADPEQLIRRMKNFISLDFALAAGVWEYLTTTREMEIASNEIKAKLMGQRLFVEFFADNQAKCIKALIDAPSIRRAYYQYCSSSVEDHGFMIVTDLMLGGKIEAVDEILKCIVKNEKIEFGPFMKKALERVFIELLKKNPVKIDMSKKLSTLLLSYVKKIKTDERAMLEQRLREIQ